MTVTQVGLSLVVIGAVLALLDVAFPLGGVILIVGALITCVGVRGDE